jgi:uncharacterized protein YegL
MQQHIITGSHYGFSATRIDDLGAAEYTLVTIAADVSGSISGFERELERAIQAIVRACRQSPRADNLMLRLTMFDHHLAEVHGFKPLAGCNPDDYIGCLTLGGSTALYDAAANAVTALAQYGKDLTDNDFDANGIVFVMTDGLDNASKVRVDAVKAALSSTVKSEALESLTSILVGVNVAASGVSAGLATLQRDAGFDKYIEIQHANASTLAKLADFVSRSISAQSVALGTGNAAPSLSF